MHAALWSHCASQCVQSYVRGMTGSGNALLEAVRNADLDALKRLGASVDFSERCEPAPAGASRCYACCILHAARSAAASVIVMHATCQAASCWSRCTLQPFSQRRRRVAAAPCGAQGAPGRREVARRERRGRERPRCARPKPGPSSVATCPNLLQCASRGCSVAAQRCDGVGPGPTG